jgi:activating signal cointegrator 1
MRRGLKKNETRSWYTSHRGWLAIHAAKKKFNPNDYLAEFAWECRHQDIWPDRLTYGAVLCIVKMVGCEKTERVEPAISCGERLWGNYEPQRYAWITSPMDMIVLPEPIPLRGHQGLFDWQMPEEVAELTTSKNIEG